ncbi:MAG: aldolase [Pirellulales bacterium]|nr:aldolase [Pirellulales bacterium]
MRKSRIKGKLSRNETALCTTLHLTDPTVFELTSLMGFDGIWMDLEHHGYSVEMAGQLMRAARVGSSDIVARPAKGEMMRMSRLLELGAQAIMYPRCDSAEEAAEVVRWAKFAPLGRRGFDGAGADVPYCSIPIAEYIEHANRETLIIVQLENEAAVAQAEAIAAVPGVDVLMIGPADFSILGGFPGDFDHPKLAKAVERIAQAARNTGKHWARPVGSIAQAQETIAQGARLIFHHADIVMVKQGLEAMQSQFASLGFKFENRLNHPSATYMSE